MNRYALKHEEFLFVSTLSSSHHTDKSCCLCLLLIVDFDIYLPGAALDLGNWKGFSFTWERIHIFSAAVVFCCLLGLLVFQSSTVHCFTECAKQLILLCFCFSSHSKGFLIFSLMVACFTGTDISTDFILRVNNNRFQIQTLEMNSRPFICLNEK